MYLCPAERTPPSGSDAADVQTARQLNAGTSGAARSVSEANDSDISTLNDPEPRRQKPRSNTTLGDGELSNSDLLADRFRALYTAMMDKQVTYKEAVEPFKTDNQNAGKG